MDERAQLVCAAPGVTLVDRSEEGAPGLELIGHSVLGKPLVDSLQEPMPVMKRLEYAIQATAFIWEPLEHLHCVVSDHLDFDSFWMAPWDAGGTHGDGCRLDGALEGRWDAGGLPALCDFLEDPALVGDSAVMSTGDCGWT